MLVLTEDLVFYLSGTTITTHQLSQHWFMAVQTYSLAEKLPEMTLSWLTPAHE